MEKKRPKVVVAMSGGVDSSVAAALLVEQGYEVIGMMLRLWSEPGRESFNRCCTPDSMALAKQIAGQLDIPFYAIDAKTDFHDIVVNYFIEGYQQGVTPNPCMMCNRHIRWEFLLNRALGLGADYMATGHYARIIHKKNKPTKLLKGIDAKKDQSYVLSILNQDQLRHALLPIGEFTKKQIREIAEDHNLPSAQAKESQDLCFLAGTDYRDFLARNAPMIKNPGRIINMAGDVLGSHEGLAFYTIGQRKGLGISAETPLYVIDKNKSDNTLIVGQKEDLGRDTLSAENVNWVNGRIPKKEFSAELKIRYSSKLEPGKVTPIENNKFSVKFNNPIRNIAPGQAAVIYEKDEVIGNGIIAGTHSQPKEFIPIKLLQPTP
ncbi:MAG: tRNA 2-thiouridine(34) synthase MnmA [Chloroflexota bacterium]